MLSAGVQKQVWGLKGTFKLAVQDAFYTFQYKGTTNAVGINNTYVYRWDNRIVTFSFTYKFGTTRFISGQDEKNEENTGKKGFR